MKKIYSDEVHRFLLQNYRKPELGRAKEKDLIARYRNGAAVLSPTFQAFNREQFTKIAGLAAMILLLPVITLFIVDRKLSLPSPVTVTYQQESPDSQYISTRKTLETGPEDILVFETDSEIVMLHENTSLSVNNGIISRLKRIDGNLYKLETGTAEINHDNRLTAEDFLLETSFGLIRIIGTEFKVTIKGNRLTIICFEGELSFKPADGSGTISIKKNQLLEIEKADSVIKVLDLSTISPDAAEERRTPFSGFRRSGSSIETNQEPETIEVEIPGEQQEPENRENLVEENEPEEGEAKAYASLLWDKTVDTEVDSALLSDDYLLLFDRETMQWLDIRTGDIIGQHQFDFKPENIQIYGNTLYLYYSRTFSAFDLIDGRERWQVPVAPMAYTSFSVVEDLIALPSADGNLYLLNRGSGERLKTYQADAGLYSKPVFLGEDIIISTMSGKILSLNRYSLDVNWTFDADNRVIGDTSFGFEEKGLAVFIDSKNRLYALDAQTGGLDFQVSLDSPVTAEPVILNDRLCLATEQSLLVLDLSGDPLLETKTDKPVLNLFLAADSNLGIIDEDGIQILDNRFDIETVKEFPVEDAVVNYSAIMIKSEDNLQILKIVH